MVSWPKLAANTNVSPLVPAAAGAADVVWVVAPAWVLVLVVSPVGGCEVVATLLAGCQHRKPRALVYAAPHHQCESSFGTKNPAHFPQGRRPIGKELQAQFDMRLVK